MKAALCGYGKMGKETRDVLISRGHQFIVIDPSFCSEGYSYPDENSLKEADVVIDFTSPSQVFENLKIYTELGKPVVMGTTGWYTQIEEVKKIVDASGIGFIWAANFSPGVNLFFRIIKEASKLASKTGYDVFAHEIHHGKKKDSPSGTAEVLGQILLEGFDNKKKIFCDKMDRQSEPDEIHISSTRGGFFPGQHTVYFDSISDTVEIRHTARNRRGFAEGAVMAAEFIRDKKGFYDFNSLMDHLFKGGSSV